MAATKQKMVTAVFRTRTDAQTTYEWLRQRGYSSQEINVLMSEGTHAAFLSTEAKEHKLNAGSEAAEGVGIGGAIGTTVGATLGAILAIGSMVAIPGLGMVAGPIVAALMGGGAGAVTGGLIGGLVGLGIPESNAKAYEEALRDGGVVIGVVPQAAKEVAPIKTYFEEHHGENVIYV